MNEPLDAKFEEVEKEAKPHWRWIVIGLALGLLPGIAGILLFIFARPQIPDYTPDLQKMRQQMAQLEEELRAMPPPPDLTLLEKRLDAAEKAKPDLSEVFSRLRNLEQLVTDQSAQQSRQINELAGKITDRPVPEYLALGMALMNWRYQLQRGMPFDALLDQIESLDGDGDERLRELIDEARPFATKGAPTLAQLVSDFPAQAIAREIEKQSFAPNADSWWGKVRQEISKYITIRRAETIADDSKLNHLASAEQYLARGDLEKALEEAAALPAPAGDWVARAKERVTADRLAAELDLLLTALVEK